MWVFWALLLGVVFSAFGGGNSRDDQIAILLTYVLDPIALVVWFLELRRSAIRTAPAFFVLAIVVATFWLFT
jgi:hypothetical protein